MRGKRSRRRGSAASTVSTPLRGSSRDRVETTGRAAGDARVDRRQRGWAGDFLRLAAAD